MEKNLQVVHEYLDYLKERYKILQDDPHGFKARLALRNEIENMTQIIEEEAMAKRFESLDAVFGVGGSKKPNPKTIFNERDLADKLLDSCAEPIADK